MRVQASAKASFPAAMTRASACFVFMGDSCDFDGLFRFYLHLPKLRPVVEGSSPSRAGFHNASRRACGSKVGELASCAFPASSHHDTGSARNGKDGGGEAGHFRE